MRPLLTLIASLMLFPCFAQTVIDVTKTNTRLNENVMTTVNGTPFVNAKFVRLVKGTPFFQDVWMKGVLVSANNHQASGEKVKLDLYDHEIHFENEAGEELLATTPAVELVLTAASGDNYRFIRSSQIPGAEKVTKRGWVQWLVNGPASLYKYYDKILTESRPYGSATTEQIITTKEKYFIAKNGTFVEIKKIKDAPDVFSDKKKEIEEFLNSRDKKDDTMDNRLSALVEYYNSLVRPEQMS